MVRIVLLIAAVVCFVLAFLGIAIVHPLGWLGLALVAVVLLLDRLSGQPTV